MAGGAYVEHEPVSNKGIQLEVRGIEEMLALTQDPFLEGNTILLQDTNLSEDPLINRLRSHFGYNTKEQIGVLHSNISLSENQLQREGGYFSAAKRAQMREHLRELGFRRIDVNRDFEFYSSFSPKIPGRFLLITDLLTQSKMKPNNENLSIL